MPRFKTFRIPGDYDEETTQWMMVFMCIPNTREWRGVVSGSIYNLSRGRNWDETTGTIKDAQEIGRLIWESMTMDCNNDLTRIADALEELNEKYIARLTWQELLDDLEETLGTTSFIYSVLKWFMDLFPSIALKADGTELLMALWRYITWSKPVLEMGQSIVRAMWALVVAVGGGGLLNTVLTGWQTLTLWFIDYLNGDVDIQDIIEDIPLSGIPTSEGGTGGDDPDNDPSIRAINNVFVENEAMSVNNNQQVTVNCAGGGQSACSGVGVSATGFIPDQTPSGTSFDQSQVNPANPYSNEDYPPEFESYSAWIDYKCKAANAMVLNFAETMYQVYAQAGIEHQQITHTLTVQAVYNVLVASDFMFGADWLYSSGFYNSLISWEAEYIADYIYKQEDLSPFGIFYDLRIEMLDNREDWVCAIFSATTAQGVKDNLTDLISTFITGASYSTEVKAWATSIIQDAFSNYWLNVPFKYYDNIAGFSDAGAVVCSNVCSTYYFPMGTATASDAGCENPEDAMGDADGVWTEGIDTHGTGWLAVELNTPFTVIADMTLEWNVDLVSGAYANWRFQLYYDGAWHNYRSLNTINLDGWQGGSLDAHIGNYVTNIRMTCEDPGPGQNPYVAVDGIRMTGWVEPE